MKAKIRVVIIVLLSGIFASMAFAEVDVPEEIRNVVPIYEGAKAVQSMKLEGAVQVVFELQTSPKEVITFYKNTMQGKGWNVVMQMEMERASMINLSKDNTNLMLNATADQKEKTMLQIILKTGN